jgi:hypothetical protein
MMRTQTVTGKMPTDEEAESRTVGIGPVVPLALAVPVDALKTVGPVEAAITDDVLGKADPLEDPVGEVVAAMAVVAGAVVTGAVVARAVVAGAVVAGAVVGAAVVGTSTENT